MIEVGRGKGRAGGKVGDRLVTAWSLWVWHRTVQGGEPSQAPHLGSEAHPPENLRSGKVRPPWIPLFFLPESPYNYTAQHIGTARPTVCMAGNSG